MATTTDPPVSQAQRRAMGAAMSGHSQLGIPASVGKEFIEEDPGGKLPERVKDEPEEEPEPLEQFRIAPGDIELANRVYGPMFGEEEEREPDAELRDAIRGRHDAITTHGAMRAAHVLHTRHGGSHPGPHADERDQMMDPMSMGSMMDQVDPASGVSRNEQEGMEGYSNPAGEPLPAAARDDKLTHGSKDEVAEYTTTQVGPPGMTLAELQKKNEEFWRQKIPGT